MKELEIVKKVFSSEIINQAPSLAVVISLATSDRISALMDSISPNEWRFIHSGNIDRIDTTSIGSQSAIYIDSQTGEIVFDRDLRETLLGQGAEEGKEEVIFRPIPCFLSWKLTFVIPSETQQNPPDSYAIFIKQGNSFRKLRLWNFAPVVLEGEGDLVIKLKFLYENFLNGKVRVAGIFIAYEVI